MVEDLLKHGELRMRKSVEVLKDEFKRLRTGRAHTGLLEHITVDYYGSRVPIHQTATVSVEDARTLLVSPWEKQMVSAVEKAIITSDLGLNPVTAGVVIRVPLPPMTEDRRRQLVRVVRHETEIARVAARNIRRDILSDVKDLLAEKMITEDDRHRAYDEVQKLTDKYIEGMDALMQEKEKEIMEF